jgi:7-cyano-7-deazaguanine synthase in queuosine biosynthesis
MGTCEGDEMNCIKCSEAPDLKAEILKAMDEALNLQMAEYLSYLKCLKPLTLREHAAIAAMQSLINNEDWDDVARVSCSMADKMVAELEVARYAATNLRGSEDGY